MIGKNNPFNIRYSVSNKWVGLDGQKNGFCNFVHLDYGIRAAAVLILRSYRMKDICTIQEIIERWAPYKENSTQAYIDFLCYKMGVFPFDIPKREEFPTLLHFISVYEGNSVSIESIKLVLEEFNITPYVRRKKRIS